MPAGNVKFTGQILPTAKKVTYTIDIKRLIARKLCMVIADGSVAVDGRTIYTADDLRVGLALHSPYTCHPEVLREAAGWARREGLPLSVHVAESPAELAMFRTGRGLFGRKVRLARALGLWPALSRFFQ